MGKVIKFRTQDDERGIMSEDELERVLAGALRSARDTAGAGRLQLAELDLEGDEDGRAPEGDEGDDRILARTETDAIIDDIESWVREQHQQAALELLDEQQEQQRLAASSYLESIEEEYGETHRLIVVTRFGLDGQGAMPEHDEIASELGISEAKVTRALRAARALATKILGAQRPAVAVEDLEIQEMRAAA